MMITFRNEPPDSEQYVALFETTGWNTKYRATPQDLADAIQRSWFLVGAYDADRLIGFGRIISDGVLYAMVYDMIVHPEYQRQGIGSEILVRLIRRCRDASIRDIQLFSAKGKESFYKKHGFKRRPDDGPGMQFRADS
jgi:GNAT superfamily N-acetyltransferase